MNFVVVGAGAWGTAFALHLVRTGHAVTLVPRRANQARELTAAHENTDYLPGVALPPALQVTAEPGGGTGRRGRHPARVPDPGIARDVHSRAGRGA